ncbi:MAG: hypothetical protein DDG59_04950 [Anaerolineae bacterium]|nr:MAG: hypothetical protein DDG59_04950 [Anaerolineae bacterium]
MNVAARMIYLVDLGDMNVAARMNCVTSVIKSNENAGDVCMTEHKSSTKKRAWAAIFFPLSLVNGFLLALGLGALVSWQTISNASFLQQIAADSLLIYEVRHAVMGLISAQSQLDQGQTSPIPLERILPDQQISEFLESGFFSLLEWLIDPSLEQPDIALDLRPLINYIESPEGKLALLPILQALPPCEVNQPMIDPAQNIVVCVQSGKDVSELIDIQAKLLGILIPEQVSFQDIIERQMISEQIWQTVQNVKVVFQRIRSGLTIVWGIYLFLCAVLLLANPAPWLKRLTDLRVSFFITGILCLFLGAGAYLLPIYIRQALGSLEQFGFLTQILRIYVLSWTARWIWIAAAVWGIALTLTTLETLWVRRKSSAISVKIASQANKPRIRKEFR